MSIATRRAGGCISLVYREPGRRPARAIPGLKTTRCRIGPDLVTRRREQDAAKSQGGSQSFDRAVSARATKTTVASPNSIMASST